MKLSDLFNLFQQPLQGTDQTIRRINTDTRIIQSGDVFVALIGENFDGHDFIEQAIAAGAIAIVASQDMKASVPVCHVSDTTAAYGLIGNLSRRQSAAKIVGLTGSCGKTTLKEMLYQIFSLEGPTTATPSNDNNTIGVPKTLLGMKPTDAYGVIEMGANAPGEIDACARIANPDIAIITMVTLQHAEGFGDLDTIAREKGAIYQHLTSGGIAVLPRDDHYYDYWHNIAKDKKCVTFGFHEEAMIRGTNIKPENGKMRATLVTPDGDCDIALSLLGKHNIYNAVAAAAVAWSMGVPLAVIARGLGNMRAVDKRLCVYRGLNQSTLIDDCYNASPASINAALEVLSEFSGKRIWIFGDMGELGVYANQMHESVGTKARDLGIDHIFAVGEKSLLTLDAFGKGGAHFEDKDALLEYVKPLLDQHTTVLIKGSRSRRLETVVAALKAI